MLKNKILLGIILSIFLLIFSINGFTAYYKYTQESGANFYVSAADKAEALEDTNQIRQVVDDLGALLVHSKRNDLYPKDGTTGGTLAIPNSALVSFATGTKGDLFYCSATNVWTKLNIGTDNQILVVATDALNFETASSALLSDVDIIAMLDEAETILANWVNTAHPWADNEVSDGITCSNYYLKTEINTLEKVETIYAEDIINDTELATALIDYYLKTAIDTLGEVEAIYSKDVIDSDELASALNLYYLKTAINTQEEVEAIWEVSLVNDGDLDLYYLKTAIDTQGEMETIWGVTLATDTELNTGLNLRYLKSEIDTQEELEAIWGVSLANDSELHTILTLGTASGLSLDGQELSLAINSDTSAGAVASGSGQVQKVWKTDGDGVPGWREDESAASPTFVALTDTPANYTGQGGKLVKVAGTEDALEFIAVPGGGDVLGPATSVDHSVARFDGTDNKTIQDSLMNIDDSGSVNIPLGETYKINTVPLAYGNIVGAAGSGANTNITSIAGLTTPLAVNQGGTASVTAGGARTALGLAYGVNVQAYDTGLLSLAALTYASPSFIKVTANDTYAIRTIAETLSDLGIDLSLYYLKTAIDSQAEVESIWGVSLANDSELYTNLTSFVDQTTWRLFYSNADGDVIELPLGADGTYLSSNGAAAAPTFETGSDKTNWVIPQDFATGSGTEGDPWANNCINSAYPACPTGGTIYLRAGYYTLSTMLNIAKAINIVGEGIGKTFIITGMTTGNAIYTEQDYVTLKGFTIDCDSQNLDSASGINLQSADYLTVVDIEAKNAGTQAINVYQCNHSLFQNLYLHGNYDHGIHPGSDTAGTNMYNTYRDIYCWDNTQYGFYDRGTEGGTSFATLEECHNVYDRIYAWDNTLIGICIQGQKTATISNCYATGNGSKGLDFGRLGNSNISNCVATLNGITSSVAGILITDCKDVNLTNVIALNNYKGFQVWGSSDTKFNSCQSYDNRKITGTDIAFVDGGAGADTITQTAAQFLTAGFEAGETITITGAAEAKNNDDFVITSVVAGTITLPTGSLEAEAAGETVTITQYKQLYGVELSSSPTGTSFANCKFSPNASLSIRNLSSHTYTLIDGIAGTTAPVAGDIQYHNGTNWIRLAKGTAGQVLTMNAGATAPEWQTP